MHAMGGKEVFMKVCSSLSSRSGQEESEVMQMRELAIGVVSIQGSLQVMPFLFEPFVVAVKLLNRVNTYLTITTNDAD